MQNRLVIIFLVCSFLSLFSCKKNIEQNLVEMLGQEVYFEPNDFYIVEGRRNFYPSETNYQLIVYLDSMECLSCASGRLHQWDDLIIANLNRKVGVEFIFSPRIKEWGLTRNSVTSSHFIRNVYIDTAGIFKKRHPWIPKENECHTFLIDKNHKVIMVGDPRRNKSLMELFKGIVSDSIVINL